MEQKIKQDSKLKLMKKNTRQSRLKSNDKKMERFSLTKHHPRERYITVSKKAKKEKKGNAHEYKY